MNPPELPNVETRNDAHVASTVAAVLAHTQSCRNKKRNSKLVMHQKVNKIKQVEIGRF